MLLELQAAPTRTPVDSVNCFAPPHMIRVGFHFLARIGRPGNCSRVPTPTNKWNARQSVPGWTLVSDLIKTLCTHPGPFHQLKLNDLKLLAISSSPPTPVCIAAVSSLSVSSFYSLTCPSVRLPAAAPFRPLDYLHFGSLQLLLHLPATPRSSSSVERRACLCFCFCFHFHITSIAR